MDDLDRDQGEPAPAPRSRDNSDDREYTTPRRVAERVAENELPKREGAPPDEHPEGRRSAEAGKPEREPEPGGER